MNRLNGEVWATVMMFCSVQCLLRMELTCRFFRNASLSYRVIWLSKILALEYHEAAIIPPYLVVEALSPIFLRRLAIQALVSTHRWRKLPVRHAREHHISISRGLASQAAGFRTVKLLRGGRYMLAMVNEMILFCFDVLRRKAVWKMSALNVGDVVADYSGMVTRTGSVLVIISLRSAAYEHEHVEVLEIYPSTRRSISRFLQKFEKPMGHDYPERRVILDERQAVVIGMRRIIFLDLNAYRSMVMRVTSCVLSAEIMGSYFIILKIDAKGEALLTITTFSKIWDVNSRSQFLDYIEVCTLDVAMIDAKNPDTLQMSTWMGPDGTLHAPIISLLETHYSEKERRHLFVSWKFEIIARNGDNVQLKKINSIGGPVGIPDNARSVGFGPLTKTGRTIFRMRYQHLWVYYAFSIPLSEKASSTCSLLFWSDDAAADRPCQFAIEPHPIAVAWHRTRNLTVLDYI